MKETFALLAKKVRKKSMYCDRGSREGISRGTLALSFGLG
jgi:hypothetical protein